MSSLAQDQVLSMLNDLTDNPPQDEANRREIYRAIQKLIVAVEDPHDTIYRVIHSPKILTVARVASDLKLFQLLDKSESLTVSQTAQAAGCDAVLAGRILRFLASHDMVKEVKEDTFAANNVTRTLAIDGFQAGMRHGFEPILPCLKETPKFLQSTKYANPSSPVNTPFQIAYKTDLPAFVFAASLPDQIADFNLWMSVLHDGAKMWPDVFDFAAHSEGSTDSSVVFVDIGGGLGQQCALLKQRFPEAKGRVILQELSVTLQHALITPGVEHQAIDMWEGQPVKGAKTYYMRNILHDYPDEKCIELLKLTAAAMSPESVLLVDEMVIPSTGAHSRATELDIEMMVALASMERTEKQWDALFGKAGFKILGKSRYLEGTGQSLIAAIPM